jgi:hypothetical protein
VDFGTGVTAADVERDVADRECLCGADCIPADFAAPSVVIFTDALAARGIAAAGGEALDEAVSCLGVAATLIPSAEVRVEGGGDGAGTVPALETAERIDRADFLAAILIRACGAGVRCEARTGVHVAAFGADFLGEFDAGFIPGVVAAERFDDADAFAAGFVVAVGVLAGDVAAAGEDFSAERELLGTQLFGAVGTHLVPSDFTAERVDVAHRVAAVGVLAACGVLGFERSGVEA